MRVSHSTHLCNQSLVRPPLVHRLRSVCSSAPASKRIETRLTTQSCPLSASNTARLASLAAQVKIKSVSRPGATASCHRTRAVSSALTDSQAMTSHKWDRITSRCVELSTVVFVFLLMPQVIKNYVAMASNNSEALAVLSWVVRQICWSKLPNLPNSCGDLLGSCTSGISHVLVWQCTAPGVLCGQTRRRCNSSPSHRRNS